MIIASGCHAAPLLAADGGTYPAVLTLLHEATVTFRINTCRTRFSVLLKSIELCVLPACVAVQRGASVCQRILLGDYQRGMPTAWAQLFEPLPFFTMHTFYVMVRGGHTCSLIVPRCMSANCSGLSVTALRASYSHSKETVHRVCT